jgi:hypothetical protein
VIIKQRKKDDDETDVVVEHFTVNGIQAGGVEKQTCKENETEHANAVVNLSVGTAVAREGPLPEVCIVDD